jgi:hypothetical protein
MDALPYLLAAQALIAAVTILWVRRYLKRLADEDGAVAAARRDVAALIAELDATTDRNLTIVEDKLSELKAALAETDKRLALLSRERPVRGGAASESSAPGPVQERAAYAAPPPRRAPPVAYDRRGLPSDEFAFSAAVPEANTRSDAAAKPAASAYDGPPTDGPTAERREAGASGRDGVPFVRLSQRQFEAEESFPDRVIRLYRKGLSADAIAANLGAHRSEVEIAIAMEESRSGSGGL